MRGILKFFLKKKNLNYQAFRPEEMIQSGGGQRRLRESTR